MSNPDTENSIDQSLKTLTEAELANYVATRAVRRISVSQNDRHRFELTIQLNWIEGEHKLITTRNSIKEWSSLDRLYRHLKTDLGLFDQLNFSISLPHKTAR